MPFPNEHAIRLENPNKFMRIRRKNNEFGQGINVIFGVTKKGNAQIQAIRFDKNKFSAGESKKWLKDHKFKSSGFEEAIKKVHSPSPISIEEYRDPGLTVNYLSNQEGDIGIRRLSFDMSDIARITPAAITALAALGIKLLDEPKVIEGQIVKRAKIIQKKEEKRLVYGVVLEPDTEDTQGDSITAEEIEKTAHSYTENSRKMDIQHDIDIDAVPVETFIAPVDYETPTGTTVKKGSWVQVTRIPETIWEKGIKTGLITGYSIGGHGTRTSLTKGNTEYYNKDGKVVICPIN